MKIPVSVAATCAMLLAQEAVACSVGDIKIKQWSWHVESGYVIALGGLFFERG